MQQYQNLAVNKRATPQRVKVKETQVKNNAGGFGFQLTDWERLDRFLILGSAGNTYYQNAGDLTKQNVEAINRLFSENGIKVVDRLVEISDAGRAPKNDPAIFVLAMAAADPNVAVRKHALEALSSVCRIPTHLFMFMEYVKLFRGRGRLLKNALQNWYMSKSSDQLVYHMLKYRQRNGWTHRDLLRLAKPKGATGIHQTMFAYTSGKLDKMGEIPKLLDGFLKAEATQSEKTCAGLISEYGLTREMIPTQFMKSPVVWEALLENMPLMAMIRNLGNMGSCGLLKPFSEASQKVISKLTEEGIQKSRLHPIHFLYALKTYGQGKGFKGSNSWVVDGKVVSALNEGFYKAFKNVTPTGKRFLIALDVSGSMDGVSWNNPDILTPREISAAMSIIHNRTEENVHYMAFSRTFMELAVQKHETIESMIRKVNHLPFSSTDCATPMIYALQHKIPVDVFVVYTDNETWVGGIHPFQALQNYRNMMGIPAKLIVCGVTSTGFTIADKDDPGMLDVVGFDSAVPQLIEEFVK